MIEAKDILADLHTHTIFSRHAYSTAYENIIAAKNVGLKYVALTDHFFGDGSILENRNELTRLKFAEKDINKCALGTCVIGGVELNLGQKIEKPERIKNLSWCISGLHDFFVSLEELSLIDVFNFFREATCYCKGFAHIERELEKIANKRYSDSPLDLEIKKFLKNLVILAKEENIYLEVNENSITKSDTGNYERMEYLIELAKDNGNEIYLGTDSHFAGNIDNFTNALKLINKIGYPKSLIINCHEDKIREKILHIPTTNE